MRTMLEDLADAWIEAKEKEKVAVEMRREIEDDLSRYLAHSPNIEGTETIKGDGVKVKITNRIDRKVDADRLQELAAEHGLSEHLGRLFRWKPEVNLTAWRNADRLITAPLAEAITATPGRPSFAIEKVTTTED